MHAARTLVGDLDRLVLFCGLVGWLTLDNVRTLLFRNTVVGWGAAVVLLDLLLLHQDLLAESLISAAGVVVTLLLVELAWNGPLGMGTVKASGLIALLIGYASAVALVIGAAIGAVTWLARRRQPGWKRTRVPAAPGMLAAALLAIAVAQL